MVEIEPNPNITGSKKQNYRGKLIFGVIIGGIILFLFAFPGILGNPIGDLLGYSRCPNCGDSWFWKSEDSIPVGPTRTLDANNIKHIIYAEITQGIMICKECLAKPAELDEERIKQNLLSYPEGGWTEEKAEEVRKAVIRYKEEKLRNQE